MTGIVEKGNPITFEKAALEEPERVETIKWQQDLDDRQADYIVINAVLAGSDNLVTLFLQKSLSKKFLEKCKLEDSQCSITVDTDFQYGQNSEKTFRFLVYHDKSNKPYQHRFITQTTAAKIAKFAKKITGKVDLSSIKTLDSLISTAQAVFGDPLRNF